MLFYFTLNLCYSIGLFRLKSDNPLAFLMFRQLCDTVGISDSTRQHQGKFNICPEWYRLRKATVHLFVGLYFTLSLCPKCTRMFSSIHLNFLSVTYHKVLHKFRLQSMT